MNWPQYTIPSDREEGKREYLFMYNSQINLIVGF